MLYRQRRRLGNEKVKKCNKKIEKEASREEERRWDGFRSTKPRLEKQGERGIEEMNKNGVEEKRETMYGRETLETVVRSRKGGGDVKGPKRSFVKKRSKEKRRENGRRVRKED